MDDSPINQLNERHMVNEPNQIEPVTLNLNVGELLSIPNTNIVSVRLVNPTIENFVNTTHRFHLELLPMLEPDLVFGLFEFDKLSPIFLLGLLSCLPYGFLNGNIDLFRCMIRVHFNFFVDINTDYNTLVNPNY